MSRAGILVTMATAFAAPRNLSARTRTCRESLASARRRSTLQQNRPHARLPQAPSEERVRRREVILHAERERGGPLRTTLAAPSAPSRHGAPRKRQLPSHPRGRRLRQRARAFATTFAMSSRLIPVAHHLQRRAVRRVHVLSTTPGPSRALLKVTIRARTRRRKRAARDAFGDAASEHSHPRGAARAHADVLDEHRERGLERGGDVARQHRRVAAASTASRGPHPPRLAAAEKRPRGAEALGNGRREHRRVRATRRRARPPRRRGTRARRDVPIDERRERRERSVRGGRVRIVPRRVFVEGSPRRRRNRNEIAARERGEELGCAARSRARGEHVRRRRDHHRDARDVELAAEGPARGEEEEGSSRATAAGGSRPGAVSPRARRGPTRARTATTRRPSRAHNGATANLGDAEKDPDAATSPTRAAPIPTDADEDGVRSAETMMTTTTREDRARRVRQVMIISSQSSRLPELLLACPIARASAGPLSRAARARTRETPSQYDPLTFPSQHEPLGLRDAVLVVRSLQHEPRRVFRHLRRVGHRDARPRQP